MAPPGRNDACPCGSGKKYKKCCALVADVSASAARLHVLDEGVVRKLAMLIRREGAEIGDALFNLERELSSDPDLPLAQLLVPMALYELPAAFVLGACALSEEADTLPVAAHLLATNPGHFDARERAWIEAQTRHVAKLWEVTDVERGVALQLRHAESGETRRILEKLGSEHMRVHSTVLGRVVDFEGLSVFCGMYPRALSPRGAEPLPRKLDRLRKAAKPTSAWIATAARTLDLLVEFARAVEVEDARLAVPPVLQNTDGDPLLVTKDRFSFPAARREEVLAALSRLDHCDPDDEDDEDCARFHFWKEGNRQHATWDNTTLAHVEVHAGTLILSTNSVERADLFAGKLADALAGIAKRGLRDHEDPAATMTGAVSRAPVTSREAMPPEAREMVERMILEQEAAWLDLDIPALGGKTPRKAMKTKKGRAALELLLKEMEHATSGRDADGLGFDAKRLRAALGL